jgi:enoyl-CoA hydratase/carnithine racemase
MEKTDGYKTIIYEPGVITKITHNEPDRANSINGSFILEFEDALKKFQRDPEARVGVIMAKGKTFCSGHDLKFVTSMEDLSKKPAEKRYPPTEEDWRFQLDFMRQKFYFPLWDCRKPLIAAVQGGAHTGGAEFAMLCDFVVASENATFDYRIMRITGVVPSQTLIYLVGYRKAMEIYLCGGSLSARQAEELGAVNKVVPAERVEEEAMRYANIIALMPPETVRLLKEAAKFFMNRMGARDLLWYGSETDILGHMTKSIYDENGRDKQFWKISKEKGLRAALDFRDEPFKKFDKE